jgi:prepilin-type N-terminal cleavage/methylation domain-containing protein
MKLSKAFTLVEIMIVCAIIGLLAAMAIPAFQKVKQASIEKAAKEKGMSVEQYQRSVNHVYSSNTPNRKTDSSGVGGFTVVLIFACGSVVGVLGSAIYRFKKRQGNYKADMLRRNLREAMDTCEGTNITKADVSHLIDVTRKYHASLGL